jgi:hypothetical protein
LVELAFGAAFEVVAGAAAAPAFFAVLFVALFWVSAFFPVTAAVSFFADFAAGFDVADFLTAVVLPDEAGFFVLLAAIVVFLLL